ncbi:type II restriction endonuclease subunit M [Nodularia spumigena CENA596]|uniref:site-specific DNA-methyltransferase (adenine-specific) n=1 Tax=Nodularia spumigena CENA596 TaxID=1819295 RepID=A0A166JXM6_NODSP|nr:DNA methyltransferase [Nodularia spumigena]KZL50277.1 type II restriction endonuclease subunit M [Nodularia spumigena CENA596]
MNEFDQQRVEIFLDKWQGSSGNEIANKDSFCLDLCTALGVASPPPQGSVLGDPYCLEKNVKMPQSTGNIKQGRIDFYKQGHFILEAKQGSTKSGSSTPKRGTRAYDQYMQKAFIQATAYAPHLQGKPPFLLTCDIGSHFELWMGFSGDYGGYGARQIIKLDDLLKADIFDLFVDIFNQPQKRNPEKIRAKVTREVADDLAKLAYGLEKQQDDPQEVANFLMRCIFTMFAEDVQLLKGEVFTKALTTRWLSQPSSFKPEIEKLWQTMDQGGTFGFDSILRFNGSLFADATAFDLDKKQLEVLLQAAKRDWSQVEPAIFGTLLERALDAKERSKLGAHYTPRSYVERLVRPVVIEPLRQDWLETEIVVDQLLKVEGDKLEPTATQKNKAVELIKEFLHKLRSIKILDPACGSGNFLYVTLDLLKSLEAEVIRRIADITGKYQTSILDQVNVSQFLGIEVNPRAASIAELVIWIGYLQWYFQQFGNTSPPEPVLQKFNNIQYRDAVLAWDSKTPAIDPTTQQPRTRWGGRTMKHPVTGENVPDSQDQVPIYSYINPREAVWPEADYIVSNPPFIGNARMRELLGDGYTETLRQVYKDVPDTIDYVMYWWHKAADLVREGKVKRFGFITTNSISQVRLRSVIEYHLKQSNPIKLIFAIPDHPWTDEGAAVRIAITAAELESSSVSNVVQLGDIIFEGEGETPEESADLIDIAWENVGLIFNDLRSGANIISTKSLKAQSSLCCTGVKVYGSGFILTSEQISNFSLQERKILKSYRNGKDIAQKNRLAYVIDCFGLTKEQIQQKYPQIYQWLLERVYPGRAVQRDSNIRDKWWLFERNRPELRKQLENLLRYIVTVETSKHRVFTFLDSSIIPDVKLTVIALDDAYFLGVLSSKIHVTWALAAGGRLGVGNDPIYNKTRCFDPFPFPEPTAEQKQKIRELGEKLDAHRKQVQAQHPDVTITGMYNLLEKLRAEQPFTDADRKYNDKALISILKSIHDELDEAVFAAYGWSQSSSDNEILTQLVALNAERTAEERNNLIRWLRPEYQAPHEVNLQEPIPGMTTTAETTITPIEQKPFPKKAKEQLAAIRDLLRTSGGEWTLEQVMKQFKVTQRQKQVINNHLESLEWFNILVSSNENGVTRWHYAEVEK